MGGTGGTGGITSPTGTPSLLTQREALTRLGVTAARPPLALASRDPAAYLRALTRTSEAAELTDPQGLGRFTWLAQPLGGLDSPL